MKFLCAQPSDFRRTLSNFFSVLIDSVIFFLPLFSFLSQISLHLGHFRSISEAIFHSKSSRSALAFRSYSRHSVMVFRSISTRSAPAVSSILSRSSRILCSFLIPLGVVLLHIGGHPSMDLHRMAPMGLRLRQTDRKFCRSRTVEAELEVSSFLPHNLLIMMID